MRQSIIRKDLESGTWLVARPCMGFIDIDVTRHASFQLAIAYVSGLTRIGGTTPSTQERSDGPYFGFEDQLTIMGRHSTVIV